MSTEREIKIKKLWLLILSALMIPAFANAGETKIMYYQSKIPGPQITKDYYIKESLKRENPKNPNILQVKRISIVTSPEGTTTYRMTTRINCETRQSATTGALDQRQRSNAQWQTALGDLLMISTIHRH
jgi:hypothetical protein